MLVVVGWYRRGARRQPWLYDLVHGVQRLRWQRTRWLWRVSAGRERVLVEHQLATLAG